MTETATCPYCGTTCHAEFVDNGVGMQQCGPFGCDKCHAVEIGPYDDFIDPFARVKDVASHGKDARVLTEQESKTGWYAPSKPKNAEGAPGSTQ